jgi:hypothetical protein
MVLFLLCFACDPPPDSAADTGGQGNVGQDPVDTTAPVVTFLAPEGDTPLVGVVDVAVEASDDVAVTAVDFSVIGAPLASLTTEPWTVSLDTTTLPNGEHDLVASAADAAGNVGQVERRILVDNPGVGADALQIISPKDGATVCGDVPIEGWTNETSVSATLFVDGEEKATDAELPWFWVWNSAGRFDGEHRIAVLATFPDGSTVVDRIVVTTKNESGKCDALPQVRITQPKGGAALGAAETVSVTASDDKGLAGVWLGLDGAELVSWTAEPFEYEWDTTSVATGVHVLSAVATDSTGQTTETRNLIVVDSTAPRARLTSPLDGDVVNGVITVTADATDDVAVKKARLYADERALGVVTAAPWVWTWDATLDSGPITLRLEAEDVAGNVGADSAEVTVDNPPVVHQTSPSDGDIVSGVVDLTATASDREGGALAWLDPRVRQVRPWGGRRASGAARRGGVVDPPQVGFWSSRMPVVAGREPARARRARRAPPPPAAALTAPRSRVRQLRPLGAPDGRRPHGAALASSTASPVGRPAGAPRSPPPATPDVGGEPRELGGLVDVGLVERAHFGDGVVAHQRGPAEAGHAALAERHGREQPDLAGQRGHRRGGVPEAVEDGRGPGGTVGRHAAGADPVADLDVRAHLAELRGLHHVRAAPDHEIGPRGDHRARLHHETRVGVVLVLVAPVRHHHDVIGGGGRGRDAVERRGELDLAVVAERPDEQLPFGHDRLIDAPGEGEEGDAPAGDVQRDVLVHACAGHATPVDLGQRVGEALFPGVERVVVVHLDQIGGEPVEVGRVAVEGVGAERELLGGLVRRGRCFEVQGA